MATYFESGVGNAVWHSASGKSIELGCLAASDALSQIKQFQPCLAFAFVSPELEISKATEGIADIHSVLRKSSANCIPIFGGSSADYFRYGPNYQINNDHVSSDAIALAFLEMEILFGLGMSHGFFPSKKRVLVTRASDHFVHEFDNRPAADVYADILGIPANRIKEELPAGPSPLSPKSTPRYIAHLHVQPIYITRKEVHHGQGNYSL